MTDQTDHYDYANAVLDYAVEESSNPDRTEFATMNVALGTAHAILALTDAVRALAPEDDTDARHEHEESPALRDSRAASKGDHVAAVFSGTYLGYDPDLGYHHVDGRWEGVEHLPTHVETLQWSTTLTPKTDARYEREDTEAQQDEPCQCDAGDCRADRAEAEAERLTRERDSLRHVLATERDMYEARDAEQIAALAALRTDADGNALVSVRVDDLRAVTRYPDTEWSETDNRLRHALDKRGQA